MSKKEVKVFDILSEGFGLYFRNIKKFLYYMSFPVLGQVLGLLLIFGLTFIYTINLPKLISNYKGTNNYDETEDVTKIAEISDYIKTIINNANMKDFDIDLKLRKLATRLFIVNKSIIPGFIKRKEIEKFIGIDENTKQLVDQYKFKLFGTKWIYAPKLWKMFNTLERKELPKKEFEKY